MFLFRNLINYDTAISQEISINFHFSLNTTLKVSQQASSTTWKLLWICKIWMAKTGSCLPPTPSNSLSTSFFVTKSILTFPFVSMMYLEDLFSFVYIGLCYSNQYLFFSLRHVGNIALMIKTKVIILFPFPY